MVTSVYVDQTTSSHVVKEFDGKHDASTIRRLKAHGLEFMGYAVRSLSTADGMVIGPEGVVDSPWVVLP